MGNPSVGTIYALVDPRTKGIRYIGLAKSPEQRLKSHPFSVGRRKQEWLLELQNLRLKPRVVALQQNATAKDEREWIMLLWEMGADLTNGAYLHRARKTTDRTASKTITVAKARAARPSIIKQKLILELEPERLKLYRKAANGLPLNKVILKVLDLWAKRS